jgi:hypothetical protein
MNLSREIIFVYNTEAPTRSNTGSGVENPLFQSEPFRTPTHTIGTSCFGSIPLIVRDMYNNLGEIPEQPMA